ncbi:MAG: hypothetical protein HC860_13855 [Alkalinema sp. RU_4_3]|nr:hypothetical protein [Alkalinema sp. RU_4_3]
MAAAHALARGECVGWIDSDDVLGMMAIDRTMALLDNNPSVGIVYTDHQLMDEKGIFGQVGLGFNPRRGSSAVESSTTELSMHGRFSSAVGRNISKNRLTPLDRAT